MKQKKKAKSKGLVKNATPNIFDGIKFRSKLETYTYKKLKEAKIYAEYEKHKFELLPAFTFHGSKVRAITYLPDFIGKNFIIECKGFSNDAFPLKEKLFKYLLLSILPNTVYYVVHTQKQVDELINKLKNENMCNK